MSKKEFIDDTVQVVKAGTCPSLSGKSKLSYQFGRNSEAGFALRILANTGSGFFNKEWLPVAAVERILRSQSVKQGLTSFSFRSLFPGKSVNSAGFILAVLKSEGVVVAHAEKKRLYQVDNLDTFLAALQSQGQSSAGKPAAKRKAPVAAKGARRPAVKRA